MDAKRFLRSINIALDVTEPARLVHFRPTSKSANLLRQVLRSGSERAMLIVAPYGSGKSLTAGYLLHAIQNEPERYTAGGELLDTVAERLRFVDAKAADTVDRRRRSGVRGVGVSLHGHHPDTVLALQRALIDGFERAGLGREARGLSSPLDAESDSVLGLIAAAEKKLMASGRDQLLIVWDEFGRHLEGLVAEGRHGELLALQVLAEVINRTKGVRISLLLLLHRSFMGYAAGLPTGVRQEWNKIEGRFQVIQFVDDSVEMHSLLSAVIRELRPGAGDTPSTLQISGGDPVLASLFKGTSDEDLRAMLKAAWPLEPATLWLLPRVSARVAQNERTAFSFLHSVDLSAPVTPEAIFDYFRGEFQADSGPGGTHRPWLEVESAIAKVGPDTIDAKVLKIAFLMGLGLSGEKSRTSRAQLELFATGSGADAKAVRAAVDRLLKRKLLIHRRQTDQVLVWHGTDVDLRGRLEDERSRIDTGFDLPAFLASEAPPPVWRPLAHNAMRGVPRYFESRYISGSGLNIYVDESHLIPRPPGTDGEVLYIIPTSEAEYEQAKQRIAEIQDPRLYCVLADSTEVLRNVALELAALLRMHEDRELLAQDPMVRSELDLLTDDVRQALKPTVERVLYPSPKGATWYHQGKRLAVRSEVELQMVLSRIMEDIFPLTPLVMSEMVVRRKPSSIVINARKKVILGILERYGQEALGIEGDFADKAIFRAVFLRTGLYRSDAVGWRFAKPDELEDEGLREVWKLIQEFFSVPGSKQVQLLVDTLREPPYGVREGLIPLLFAAALKAFPTPKALRAKADFLGDLLPSIIEDVCRNPEDFILDVVALSEDQEEYLQEVLALFAAWSPSEGSGDDLIRQTFDAVQGWWNSLPGAARSSTSLSKDSRKFRMIIAERDPVAVLLRELPKAFGSASGGLKATLEKIKECVRDLESVHTRFVTQARLALRNALKARGLTEGESVGESGQAWASFFPTNLPLRGLSPIARSVLLQLRRAHESDETLLNALALLVTGHAFKDWTDAMVPEFERRLRTVLEDIEHVALEAGLEEGAEAELTSGLVGLAQARLRLALNQLATLAGESEAIALVDDEITKLGNSTLENMK